MKKNLDRALEAVAGCMHLARRLAAAFVALLALSTTAHAQGGIPGYPASVYAFDPREIALLPRYCRYTQHFRDRLPEGRDVATMHAWQDQLGEAYQHMHHYCYGLMKFSRATLLARDSTTRTFYLNDAIEEFNYVIDRSPEDFVLLPEIVTKKGEALLLIGKAPSALLFFDRAIQLKGDYWPPYAKLSDYYRETGDIKQAREILDKGLAQMPQEKALLRRRAELDKVPSR